VAVLATAKVGEKFRLYLPPEVRAALAVGEGDHVVFREERGRVWLEKLK
jgi:AbrB family looped-hinge helix DNA binding protein